MKAMKTEAGTNITDILSEGCSSKILSFTSPHDACRSSLVSRSFLSAAGADLLWERFLPPDYRQIIFQSESPASSASSPLNALSKKDLYFYLCHNPILIGDGNRSFAIEKSSGKKCYMLGPRELTIIWEDTTQASKWISSDATIPRLPKSRFSEPALLFLLDNWVEIKGRIETKILSPNTRYGAYFIYSLDDDRGGYFHTVLVMVSANLENENEGNPTTADLLSWSPSRYPERYVQCRRYREDGSLEIELGDFFNGEVDSAVNMCLRENEGIKMMGRIVLHGIEVRPKE